MKSLRTEAEIIASWAGKDINAPLVSVCCITFNHGPYIEDALRGFLVQETNFPFEIWVHDDASTDGTADIVRTYQKAYPNLIRAVLQTENQYSKGNRGAWILGPLFKGKYVAYCEGDDYWADPLKLQKQADYLELHPEVVISGHDSIVIDDQGNKIAESRIPECYKRDSSSEELILNETWVLTLSWMYRNVPLEIAPERRMVRNGDNFFFALIGQYGSCHYHSDIQPAVYRVHQGGVWSMISDRDQQDSLINTWFWIYRYFSRTGQEKYARFYWKKFLYTVLARCNLGLLIKEFVLRLLSYRALRGRVERIFRKLGRLIRGVKSIT